MFNAIPASEGSDPVEGFSGNNQFMPSTFSALLFAHQFSVASFHFFHLCPFLYI
jgi:hypothetical protein